MQPWRLRVVCVPQLRKVLEVIEQIEDFCVEQFFYNIEQALTTFWEKLEGYKEEHYDEEYRNERHLERQ